MQTYCLEQLDRLPRETALTVGIFDGVHRGHQALVRTVVEAAARRGLLAAAMTFDPHPAEVVAPAERPALLTTVAQRSELLAGLGLDALVVAHALRPLFALEAEPFVRDVLVGRLRARHVVEGPDWTFGRGRRGTMALLRGLGCRHGFEVTEVPWLEVGGRRVSSTVIRALVLAGDVTAAAEHLGRRYFVDGAVVRGAGRGGRLGFPTANVRPANELLPAPGVYAGETEVASGRYFAAIFVGRSMTFAVPEGVVEAHLLDFPGGRLEGQAVRVRFAERLRDGRRFATPEDLARQIRSDVEAVRAAAGRWSA